jgi:hypothetical protein
LLKTKRLSYSVIAEMMGTTRNVVAGIAFRKRHPCWTRVDSPNARLNGGGGRNKIGHGYMPRSYWPEKTTANSR